MTAWLREQRHEVNPKRVRRLLREMGLWTIYQKPCLGMAGADHRIYPYLLRGVAVNRPNHVWATGITYIRRRQGFVSLAAVLDWYSRYTLAWKISLTLELEFCLVALEVGLEEECPEVSTAVRGYSSPAMHSRDVWRKPGSGSAWMEVTAVWTTSSWNGCGRVRSTWRCI